MQSKLTLRLDDSLIRVAKAYAREADKSLSQVVADYFSALAARRGESDLDMASLPSITRSLIGSVNIENTIEDERYTYLMEKYK